METEFDTARQETQQLFEELPRSSNREQELSEQPEIAMTDEGENDIPQDLQPGEDKEIETAQTKAVLDDAVNSAETAAQAALDMNEQLKQLREQNSQLMQQNSQLQEGFGALKNQMQQMNEQQKESIVGEVYEKPVIDLATLAFADEAEMKRQQDEYAEAMAQYVKRGVMDELSPFVEEAKRGRLEREKTAVIDALSKVPELEGIKELIPQMGRIIENNAALRSDDIPLDEKYISAYAIARGVNAINTPHKEPTAEDFMRLYEENPEFQELIEKKRLSDVKQNQQVPPMSASHGAVNAALNIKEKPKSWEDASERTKKMFGA